LFFAIKLCTSLSPRTEEFPAEGIILVLVEVVVLVVVVIVVVEYDHPRDVEVVVQSINQLVPIEDEPPPPN
jgi:hypothetical protein